ncbi:MAG: hypothetical protein JWM28_1850 [Chitinophagaceae bacterium]|nr:hypothetical protein [Chitinophagaceae bacterium]
MFVRESSFFIIVVRFLTEGVVIVAGRISYVIDKELKTKCEI